MSTHSKAAAKFIADAERTAWHDKALYAVREKRDKMARTVPEWEDLRRMSSEIKRHTLSHLGYYLEEFERNATANGMAVHWAADADEMNATVWRLVQEHGGRNLIKSKSMLSEECGLTPYLRERGVDAVESDLGERIMQLLELPPSHIVLPAIGVRREEVGELFEREFGTEHGNSDPTYLTHEARRQLRPKFLGADIAMTGVNFAVASTGTLAVCTNEGNADMGTSFPDLHIAIMGLEKVIPDMRALAVFTRLLARSGTGQPVTSYTSLYRKPAPGKRIHVVIVDNGRSEWLADAAHRNMLKCLRCGACMNTCPVYRRSGGYSYSYFIPGAGHQPVDAAFAEAPPRQCLGLLAVLLLLGRMPGDDRPRGNRFTHGGRSWRPCIARPVKKLTVKGMDFIMGGRRRFYGGIALARVAEHLPHAVLNNRFNPWSAPGRDMPPFAPKTFNALWKRGEVKSGKTSKDE